MFHILCLNLQVCATADVKVDGPSQFSSYLLSPWCTVLIVAQNHFIDPGNRPLLHFYKAHVHLILQPTMNLDTFHTGVSKAFATYK